MVELRPVSRFIDHRAIDVRAVALTVDVVVGRTVAVTPFKKKGVTVPFFLIAADLDLAMKVTLAPFFLAFFVALMRFDDDSYDRRVSYRDNFTPLSLLSLVVLVVFCGS